MPKSLSGVDRKFVLEARPMGLAEIKMSQVASDFATKAELKEFARQIIQDHTQTTRQLMQLVKGADLALPDTPDQLHEKLIDKLWSLEGEAFDSEYLRAQIRDHEQALSLYRSEAETGADPGLKEFAKDCLPILERHLIKAKTIAKAFKI